MLTQYEKDSKNLKRIHEIICSGSSGTREQFARKLEISSAQLSKYLTYMKKMGVKVEYNRLIDRYEYESQSVYYNCGFEIRNDIY